MEYGVLGYVEGSFILENSSKGGCLILSNYTKPSEKR